MSRNEFSLVLSSLTCSWRLLRAAWTAENVESANAGDLALDGEEDLEDKQVTGIEDDTACEEPQLDWTFEGF